MALLCVGASIEAQAESDFSGVWGMVQHDRLGALFFIPIEPKLNAAGMSVTEAFVAKYDVEKLEANGSCVEPGMPTVMWESAARPWKIVQQPRRITLLSELTYTRNLRLSPLLGSEQRRAHGRHVPMIGSTTPADHVEDGATALEPGILAPELQHVADVELRCFVQLRMAPARRVGTNAAQARPRPSPSEPARVRSGSDARN